MSIESVKVNSKNQITIPKPVREILNIKAGDSLFMDVQDGIMVLIPQPESYASHLQGLHSDIWKSVDVEKYLNDERGAW